MSLINDALKRASQAQPPPPPTSETTTPMCPAEDKRPSAWPLLVVPLLLLCVVAIAAWFVLKGVAGGRKEKLSAIQTAVAAREMPAQTQPASPLAPAGPESADGAKGPPDQSHKKPGFRPVSNTPESARNANASTGTAGVEVGDSEGAFPSLKLQTLFYRAKNPSVVINSKTLYVGDRVEHAKVISIQRDSVTLEWKDETHVLTLE